MIDFVVVSLSFPFLSTASNSSVFKGNALIIDFYEGEGGTQAKVVTLL